MRMNVQLYEQTLVYSENFMKGINTVLAVLNLVAHAQRSAHALVSTPTAWYYGDDVARRFPTW